MIPTEPFSRFSSRFAWRQGEHVLFAAPTQCGKTTMAARIASRRHNVVVLASKTRDDNLRQCYRGYDRYASWPPRYGSNRVLLWPKRPQTLSAIIDEQRAQFGRCLNDVGRQGGWCVVVDEAHWLSQFLRLDRELAILHHQGSSSGVSMVVLTQRPAWIPRIIYSSATHVFVGHTTARDDLKALASLSGNDARDVSDTVAGMGRHDMLYLNPLGSADPAVINIRK